MSTHHLIQWNASRSCYEILGHFFSLAEATKRRDQVKKHFQYRGQELEIISSYQLGYLEAAA